MSSAGRNQGVDVILTSGRGVAGLFFLASIALTSTQGCGESRSSDAGQQAGDAFNASLGSEGGPGTASMALPVVQQAIATAAFRQAMATAVFVPPAASLAGRAVRETVATVADAVS